MYIYIYIYKIYTLESLATDIPQEINTHSPTHARTHASTHAHTHTHTIYYQPVSNSYETTRNITLE